jgi:hypothetical protein
VKAPFRFGLVPPGVVMLTALVPRAAPAVMLNVAVTVVAFTTTTLLALTPVLEKLTAVAPVRLVPVKVTATVVPRAPEVGVSEVSVGTGTARTVKAPFKLGLVPPGVVMLTARVPTAAPAVMLNVAVTVVAFRTTTLLALTPVPEKLTAVVPVRLVPVRVTATAVPRVPEVGASEVSVGATTVNAPF